MNNMTTTRRTRHPNEPALPADLVRIDGVLHMRGRCPHCGVRVDFIPKPGHELDGYFRRTCLRCNLPSWITEGDYMTLPKTRR